MTNTLPIEEQNSFGVEAAYMQSVLNKELEYTSRIAVPLANEKLEKRLIKLLKKGGDVTPEDTVTHFPVLCEEKGISYCFIRFQHQLCIASGFKEPSPIAMVVPGGFMLKEGQDSNMDSYKEMYDKCIEGVKNVKIK